MPDISPALIYDSLDERRLALFIGRQIEAPRRRFIFRQLADFVLQTGIATVILAAPDTDLRDAIAGLGADVDFIAADADLAALRPDRTAIFSPTQEPGVLSLLGQRLAGQMLLCYGVDPADEASLPSATGWPGVDPDRPTVLIWEDIDSDFTGLRPNVAVLDRDPFGLLYPQPQSPPPGGDDQSKGDIDYHAGGDDDKGSDTPPPPPPPPPPSGSRGAHKVSLRIDAAVPERVVLNQAFILAVAVRQPNSPLLAEEDLTVVRSGRAEVAFQGQEPAQLRLRVSAPDCRIDGRDSVTFSLAPGEDKDPVFFNLTPLRAGKINIIIYLFQKSTSPLGNSRLSTQVEGEVSGQVAMQVQSHPLAAMPLGVGRQVEEKERQYQTAAGLLTRLIGELSKVPHGEVYALLEARIDETKELIKQLGREIDEIVQPA